MPARRPATAAVTADRRQKQALLRLGLRSSPAVAAAPRVVARPWAVAILRLAGTMHRPTVPPVARFPCARPGRKARIRIHPARFRLAVRRLHRLGTALVMQAGRMQAHKRKRA